MKISLNNYPKISYIFREHKKQNQKRFMIIKELSEKNDKNLQLLVDYEVDCFFKTLERNLPEFIDEGYVSDFEELDKDFE